MKWSGLKAAEEKIGVQMVREKLKEALASLASQACFALTSYL